jgi:hypothetical protein
MQHPEVGLTSLLEKQIIHNYFHVKFYAYLVVITEPLASILKFCSHVMFLLLRLIHRVYVTGQSLDLSCIHLRLSYIFIRSYLRNLRHISHFLNVVNLAVLVFQICQYFSSSILTYNRKFG